MEPAVRNSLPELVQICRDTGITRLSLCGSAARDEFDPGGSDLDFLAIFAKDNGHAAHSYFSAKEKLEALFERRVDLLTPESLANPFMREAVEHDEIVLCETIKGQVVTKTTGKLLHDAISAIADIQDFMKGKTLTKYKRDKLLRAAVERKFEVLGEALNQLSKLEPT